MKSLDCTKLLGFDMVGACDFANETVSAQLGAKVGLEVLVALDLADQKQGSAKLNFSRLLGFDTLAEEMLSGLDLQDETVCAKLGAKVGLEPVQEPKSLEFGKLLGFETISDQIAGRLNFQEESLSAKLGAKVGVETVNAPGSLDR